MSEIEEDKLYELVLNKVFPRQAVINVATNYYGGEYKDYISDRVNNIDVLLYAKDIFSYRVMDLFVQEADKKGYVTVQEDIDQFIKDRQVFYKLKPQITQDGKIYYSKENKVLLEGMKNFENLIQKYPESISKMGFDFSAVKKIQVEDSEFSFYDVRESVVKQFTNYAMIGQSSYKLSSYVDASSLAEKFNKCIDAKVTPLSRYLQKEDDVEIVVPEVDKIDDSFIPLKDGVEYKKFNLEGKLRIQVEMCTSDIMIAKLPLELMDDKTSAYFIECVNFLFDTKYTKIEEIIQDPTMQHLIDFIESNDLANKELRAEQYKQNFLASSRHKREFFNARKSFEGDSNTVAYYKQTFDLVALSLSDNLRTTQVLHEMNHALSKMDGVGVGFRETEEGRAFNEIVNEFLTKRMMQNAEKEDLKEFSMLDHYECGYNTAISYMEPLLLSLEDKLKECQVCAGKTNKMDQEVKSASQILSEYIGQNNYNNLIFLTSNFSKCDYGKFVLNDGYVRSAEQLVEIYTRLKKEEPDLKVSEKYAGNLNWLMTLKDFITKLEKMNEAVKRGELESFTDIEIKFDHGILTKQEQNIETNASAEV